MNHLRVILFLIFSTLILCSVIYPGALWIIGQTVFPHQAQGSLVDKNGMPTASDKDAVGSTLIAQPFTADEYFQPRPSAAFYNGGASAASNWGGNNYLLRARVAQALGPIVKYADGPKKGKLVGPDVEAWFRSKPDLVGTWAEAHPTLAQNWVKADTLNADYITSWQEEHAEEVAAWKKDNPGTPEPKPVDLAVVFFKSYSKTFPGTWPLAMDHKTSAGKTEKRIEPARKGADIQKMFFDEWRQAHPDIALEQVPADLVMASGSGLDPHITLANARYQLDRVAAAWVAKTKRDPTWVRSEIEKILAEKQQAPLGGLAGVPLVNVVAVNLTLAARLEK